MRGAGHRGRGGGGFDNWMKWNEPVAFWWAVEQQLLVLCTAVPTAPLGVVTARWWPQAPSSALHPTRHCAAIPGRQDNSNQWPILTSSVIHPDPSGPTTQPNMQPTDFTKFQVDWAETKYWTVYHSQDPSEESSATIAASVWPLTRLKER